SPKRLRQANRQLVATPCCRATCETTAPGANTSATNRRFSSSLQRRRGSLALMISTLCTNGVSNGTPLETPLSHPDQQGGPRRTDTGAVGFSLNLSDASAV